jgi:hypothetical protein
MNKAAIHKYLYKYRFEFLLMALLLLIFDKIFFADNAFYLKYVWLSNMVVINIASHGMYTESGKKLKLARNIFSLIAIALPFAFILLGYSPLFLQILTRFLILLLFYFHSSNAANNCCKGSACKCYHWYFLRLHDIKYDSIVHLPVYPY